MTTDWNGFRGAAKRIEDIDIPRIGATIGVGEDEVHAFMDVEAAGAGFDSTGRPKMLFEPHVFYRNLSGEKRARAVKAGLAYAKWRRGNYPKDSYPRLAAAMAIDETAALKSASWGLGQILGENHVLIGYASPQAMVRAFLDDEETHLEAIVAFLRSAKLDDNLRNHDWVGVARGYNGPGYATHNYHGRMARAYAMWRKIPDTPWTPTAEHPIPTDPEGPRPTLRVGDGITRNVNLSPYVREAQEILGLTADGKFGEATKAAVKAFQRSRGLTADGVIGGQTWTALLARPKSDPLHVPPPAEPAAPDAGGAKVASGAAVAAGGTAATAAAASGRWGLAAFIALLAVVAAIASFIVLRKKR